jgi:uracil-DNA glycosylase
MGWSERQLAMLREMGIRVWPTHAADPSSAHATPLAMAPAMRVSVDDADATLVDDGSSSNDAPAAAQEEPSVRRVQIGPRPQGVHSMDWGALREAAGACTACKLCAERKQVVFGAGSTQAQWLIVGEAPGEQEDLQGEPFVGKSGQLLDAMLRAIGLTRGAAEPRHQVYIANTIKCRPPGNRNPQPDELAQCEPFLIRQVGLLQPRIILAMGRFAVQSLLRSSEPVGQLRGRVHRYQGVPLIVTYHPAYLLRNPQDKARAWDDLCLAVETASLTAPR